MRSYRLKQVQLHIPFSNIMSPLNRLKACYRPANIYLRMASFFLRCNVIHVVYKSCAQKYICLYMFTLVLLNGCTHYVSRRNFTQANYFMHKFIFSSATLHQSNYAFLNIPFAWHATIMYKTVRSNLIYMLYALL